MRANSLSIFAIALATSGSAFAGLTVDGNLADWKIDKTTWVSSLPNVHSTIEDSTGSGAYYLSPGYGGQAYDAEALYATIQGDKLFIALATGHNPLTVDKPSANIYAAGDFAIDFGKNGSYDLGINVVNNFNGGLLGGVYSSPTWAYGLWSNTGTQTSDPTKVDKTHPSSLLGGTLLGSSAYSYTTVGASGWGSKTSDLHYFYEVSLDLSLLHLAGWDGSEFNIQWTENCANDSILVDPGHAVPEPGSLALAFVGMAGLTGIRRRRKSAVVQS